MSNKKTAVVGVGATGSVLAAALLKKAPETVLVDPMPGLGDVLIKKGIEVKGTITYNTGPIKFFHDRVGELKKYDPGLLFISTKTFHLPQVLKDLEGVVKPETRIISTHNGLGPEDLIADKFGTDKVFRMSLNYGASVKGPGLIESTFFNKPNHIGCLEQENRETGLQIADLLTSGGLDTGFVEDIRLYVWKKMIMKCTMASICAVTDYTIKDALDFPPTREIADACFGEILAVAKEKGYDLGEGYMKDALGYLEKVGGHKDSMCFDIASRTRTEIDFLGGKVVEYGLEKGIPTPFFTAMSNLVRALENKYP